ncbi:MAG: FIST C-terminal domain-containing protein [Magnetococcales bacterium]|nr:FIST C-terminal domain-containing protein [Magnetococcales bacterium]
MDVRQVQFYQLELDESLLEPLQRIDPMLVLVFADKHYFLTQATLAKLLSAFPSAHCVGVSTAGEISNQGTRDGSCVVTAVRFRSGSVQTALANVSGLGDSWQAGVEIGNALSRPGLRALLLFAPGLAVNGSALLAGLQSVVGQEQLILGGLACESGVIRETLVMTATGSSAHQVVAVGLYGAQLVIRCCSRGGWVPFGPLRQVTRCQGNLLLELDGEPAMDLYFRYLGEYAKEFPESGLRFPFEMYPSATSDVSDGVIRTVLGSDPQSKGLILGGDINPEGCLRLMHVTTAKLVDGARQAADGVLGNMAATTPGLGLLISCVGRKLILGERIVEEVEAVQNRLGRHHTVAGFYAHGEIGPIGATPSCALHNQTMTIALIGEDE